MTQAILVRHAATAWTGRRYCGRRDPWLSPEGRRSADALAASLAATIKGPVRIVSSPRRRSRQTARAIADALGGVQVTIDPRWAEADFGRMEGRTFEAIERSDPDLARRLAAGDRSIDWPGGETTAALEARVMAALEDVDRWLADGITVVVVSHGGPIRLVLSAADPGDPTDGSELAAGAARVLRRGPVLRSRT